MNFDLRSDETTKQILRSAQRLSRLKKMGIEQKWVLKSWVKAGCNFKTCLPIMAKGMKVFARDGQTTFTKL